MVRLVVLVPMFIVWGCWSHRYLCKEPNTAPQEPGVHIKHAGFSPKSMPLGTHVGDDEMDTNLTNSRKMDAKFPESHGNEDFGETADTAPEKDVSLLEGFRSSISVEDFVRFRNSFLRSLVALFWYIIIPPYSPLETTLITISYGKMAFGY